MGLEHRIGVLCRSRRAQGGCEKTSFEAVWTQVVQAWSAGYTEGTRESNVCFRLLAPMLVRRGIHEEKEKDRAQRRWEPGKLLGGVGLGEGKMGSMDLKLPGESVQQGVVTNGEYWGFQTGQPATVVQGPDPRLLSKLKGGLAYPSGQS